MLPNVYVAMSYMHLRYVLRNLFRTIFALTPAPDGTFLLAQIEGHK